jgi:hypothetical protein
MSYADKPINSYLEFADQLLCELSEELKDKSQEEKRALGYEIIERVNMKIRKQLEQGMTISATIDVFGDLLIPEITDHFEYIKAASLCKIPEQRLLNGHIIYQTYVEVMEEKAKKTLKESNNKQTQTEWTPADQITELTNKFACIAQILQDKT